MYINDLLAAFKRQEIDAKYFSLVKDEWKRFQEGKQISNHIVPQEIIDSWLRSKSYAVDPNDQGYHLLDSYREMNVDNLHDVIPNYDFFFQTISQMFDFTQYVFSFVSADGITKIVSNQTGNTLPTSLAFLSENIVGTTGSSITLHLNQPTIMLQPFYYRQFYMQKMFGNLHGVQAPIHDNKNQVIGVLGLGYYDLEKTVHAYNIISLISNVFDALYLPVITGHEKQIQEILSCLPQGVVLLNERNTVQFYNEKIVKLLGIKKKQNVERELNKYFPKMGVGLDYPHQCDVIQDGINARKFKLIQLKATETIKEGPSGRVRGDQLFTFDRIIGESEAIKKAKDTAMNVAETSVPVLLYGESGTGKEMFAQAIHSAGSRRSGPFIAINCGALPGELVESELFGYEEGSFTGALKGGKVGKLEAASRGTLFLDEIESMPLKDQIKLLRVLSTGRVQKIGSNKEIEIDVRLISATKTDLLKQADEGAFREDLFYRISTFIVKLPPLRARQRDIILLAEEFVRRLQDKYHRHPIAMDATFTNALLGYHWRGNVRELEHAMERAVIILRNGSKLLPEHLSETICEEYKKNIINEVLDEVIEHTPKEQGMLAEAENMLIERVLKAVNGNISAAAEMLGITRRTIYKRMNKSEADVMYLTE
ncbi:Signal-transduction and transcriptional-control protein [Desulfitobacterium hafniense]|uniref:Signal-transduction and transcriptional-control protein n=1 Tax=Desulfitobacterium hafniense TaxID=49338 RepID=A0A098B512_DESHA|nr:sigma 54-interacting transcriptional regulator [Desulfitobacterium hafniense]CDX03968.1 Signal-transduction and transcriptional-control protein [Desulfitobacterium hafniense]